MDPQAEAAIFLWLIKACGPISKVGEEAVAEYRLAARQYLRAAQS